MEMLRRVETRDLRIPSNNVPKPLTFVFEGGHTLFLSRRGTLGKKKGLRETR